MNRQFTLVEIAFYPEFLNHWLRFGVPDLEFDLDRRRALACFKPGRIFGYVRWIANEYGTQKWQLYVVRTVDHSRPLSRINGVHPSGEILLKTAGTTKVKRALVQIDVLEVDGFDPTEVSPAYYRHVHNRITTGHPARVYSSAQHEAYLAAQRLVS